MTPKERRDRLLKDRPNAKQITLEDGGPFFWAAYKAGTFQDLPPDLSPQDFAGTLQALVERYDELWFVEDYNRAYRGKPGPVAFVGLRRDGLLVQLEAIAFKWATIRNMLRCSVAFLNKMRHSTKVGVCMIKGHEGLTKFMGHLEQYGVLYYIGRVSENERLYSVRGRYGE